MAEWVDRKSQVRTSMGLTTVKEEKSLEKAMAEEARRAARKESKRQELLQSTSYSLSEGVATLMDRYFLDAIIGLIPGVGDILSSVFVMPQLYLCIFKIRSIALTLAVLNNYMIDMIIGLIPFWVGNIADFFYKAHRKNLDLILGYIDDDQSIIEEVNKKAVGSAIILVALIAIFFSVTLISSIIPVTVYQTYKPEVYAEYEDHREWRSCLWLYPERGSGYVCFRWRLSPAYRC